MRATRSAGNFGTRKSFASRDYKLRKGARIFSCQAPNASLAAPAPRLCAPKNCPLPPPSNVLKAAGGTDLMTNKSHAIIMSLFRIGMLAAQIAVGPSAAAQSTAGAGSKQPALMDRDREIALALSACPPFVMSKAAVYVLEKSGYVKIRDSENGFSAIVQDSLSRAQCGLPFPLGASDRAGRPWQVE